MPGSIFLGAVCCFFSALGLDLLFNPTTPRQEIGSIILGVVFGTILAITIINYTKKR